MKLLYLTVWDFQNAESNGICKKILTQVRTLRNMGFEVDFGYTKQGVVYLEQGQQEKKLGSVPASLNIVLAHNVFASALKNTHYDGVYIRHCASNPCYIHLLSILKKYCDKILVEFPTYPYDKELTGDIKMKLGYFMDHTTRGFMKKYVDKVVTYSNDTSIFGIPTIKTMNGVDFANIPMVKNIGTTDKINLIAVAMLSPWHGYDRVISGLKEYYSGKLEKKKKVCFHLVGEGKELEKYKEMVSEYHLSDVVKFYGNQAGESLNKIYEKADIAVSSLGLHRIGLKTASTLKAREYGARGLPMVSAHSIDFFSTDSSYVLQIPEDDTPVNIDDVVAFYQKLIEKESVEEVHSKVREITRKKADMSVTFEPIKKFYEERI